MQSIGSLTVWVVRSSASLSSSLSSVVVWKPSRRVPGVGSRAGCGPSKAETDEDWLAIFPLLPGAAQAEHRRRIDLRKVLKAIPYIVRSGCGWRMLPVHFPAWQMVYWCFRRFERPLFRTIHDVAVMTARERAGRDQPGGAAILDGHAVKAAAAGGTRGYDGAEMTVGRKRHIAVDTEGRPADGAPDHCRHIRRC